MRTAGGPNAAALPERPLQPPLSAGCLITVLSASRERRHALLGALHGRLATQGFATHLLSFQPPPSSGTPTDALAAQQQALGVALERSVVLSEGGVALLAAGMGLSAPDALVAAAQAQLARSALVLLCAASAQDNAATHSLDAQLRRQLLATKVAFSVLHGDADSALEQAWQALCLAVNGPRQAAQPADATASHPWLGSCDACSDSACEHRLFSDLLQRRGGA